MTTLVKQLHAWQFRELLYSAAVAAGVVAAVATVGVAAACATDYCIDLYRDTPKGVRIALAAGQLAAYGGLALLLFLAVRNRLPSVDVLAGRAEAELPVFDHRLVTSLQLNRPHANTAGMSKELIAQVSAEAETMARQHRLASLANPRRLGWAAALFAVPLLVFGIAFLAFPKTATALLLRQCLLDVAIPKSVTVEDASPKVWPSGDEVVLTFRVTGPVTEATKGRVTAWTTARAEETAEATFAGYDEAGIALFAARFPGFIEDFRYRAFVRDGRMQHPSTMTVVARPVVSKVTAWVQLPKYVDPAGVKRYERIAPEGEVSAHVDSSLRVVANFSKPVAKAELVLYGRSEPGAPELEHKRFSMATAADHKEASVTFDMPTAVLPSGYAVQTVDEHGFANLSPPKRGITVLPDAPPRVELLDEVMKAPRDPGPLDYYEIRGAPLTMNGQAIIGYKVRSPLGISKAYIVYRVNDEDWRALPLAPVEADTAKVGQFVPPLGVFENYDAVQSVEFYPIPPVDPESEPVGLAAGGRVNFQTAALTKTNAETMKPSKLELGDRVEFYVAVYDRKPGPQQPAYDRGAGGRQPGVSESRIKQVVTQAQYLEWTSQKLQSQERLKKLEELQRGVFGQKGPNPK